jgi:guanylate kinase
MSRIDRHNSESDQLAQRLDEAKRSFEFALNDKETHFILNDDLDMAVHQTEMLLNGKTDSARESTARQSAEQIFKELTFA